MGRAYQDELTELAGTAQRIPGEAVHALSSAAQRCAHDDLIAVASGGAGVVAQWLALLHSRHFGCAVQCLTPLQYAAIERPLKATTWLISAGGAHRDILHAAEAGIEAGARRIVALIGRDGSRLARLLEDRASPDVVSLKHPPLLDGYLTTNGLWSMVLAVWQAYNAISAVKTDVAAVAADALKWAEENSDLPEPASDSLIVLHDAWTALGAFDFETRCIEASLANIWIADYRNFGHGRHFWLQDRGAQTQVVALIGNGAVDLANATLDEIPGHVRIERIRVPFEREACAVASLAWSMHRAAPMGRLKSRDPGRPGIPAFGERLYEGRFPWPERKHADTKAALALERKLGFTQAQSLSAESRVKWLRAFERFKLGLRTPIRGAVFDYDGTLVETERRFEPIDAAVSERLLRLLGFGVPIGIATGRGDSVHKRLIEIIPPELRERVIIGYHNGSTVRNLAMPVDDLDSKPIAAEIREVEAVLTRTLAAAGLAVVRARGTQCSLTPMAGLRLARLWRQCNEALAHALPGVPLKVLLSSHSIDVTTAATSKLHVVYALEELAQCTSTNVLRVGDRGGWPGNDYELLRAPLGISVDECSLDPDSCWNIAPRSCAGPRALIELLDAALANSHDGDISLRDRE
jgi:hypothetical protein